MLSSHNNFWNRYNIVNNQLCNHLLDQLQSFKCYHVIKSFFTGWSRKFDSLIITLWSFISISGKNILCNFFYHHNFQMIKQKVYLFLEKVAQLWNLNVGFVGCCTVTFGWYFIFLIWFIVLSKPDFNCSSSLHYLALIKLQQLQLSFCKCWFLTCIRIIYYKTSCRAS